MVKIKIIILITFSEANLDSLVDIGFEITDKAFTTVGTKHKTKMRNRKEER